MIGSISTVFGIGGIGSMIAHRTGLRIGSGKSDSDSKARDEDTQLKKINSSSPDEDLIDLPDDIILSETFTKMSTRLNCFTRKIETVVIV
jgi:hypothetical protein